MATRRQPPRGEAPSKDDELFYVSINPAGSTTVIFLHGVLSCHLEWEHVTPYLSPDYHLIVVDLNGHSNSSKILPVLLPASTDCVADLITRHAHGGKAHVVGLSMGGFIALELGRCYPELVHSVCDRRASIQRRLQVVIFAAIHHLDIVVLATFNARSSLLVDGF